jgi:hypothetical protein
MDAHGEVATTRHIFVVQTDPAERREDEYNDWHTNVHLPDALAVAIHLNAAVQD